MEHKLISGGEIYLPFARSRIKALRATGLEYASQQFEIDGCSVKVRIEPGHEYIWLGDEGVNLKMDSGVVDIVAVIEEWHPDNYLPRLLYETAHNKSYNSLFSKVSNSGWRSNPTKTQQVSGELTVASGIKGRVPQDAQYARSFLPAIIPGGAAPTTPEPLTLNQADEAVWGKKLTATKCPASMFTGRCRLYVQAMYGQYMHDGKMDGDGALKSATSAYTSPQYRKSAVFGWPSLIINSYLTKKEIKEGVSAVEVILNTSTGVFFDPETGEHWLMNPGVNSITAYPLIADVAGEKARKFLIEPKRKTLSEVDREHLETYILATSKPHASKAQNCSLGGDFPGYSMGYGWHWNWDGTRADIVVNVAGRPVASPDGFSRVGMTSTHYMLTTAASRTDAGVSWSASAGVVEGPVNWATNRGVFSVTEPNWVFQAIEKSLPRYSIYEACDAPFYVFYRRNEIQLCRYTCTYIPGQPNARSESSYFSHGASWPSIGAGNTYGTGGGFLSDKDTAESFRAGFSCGSVSTPTRTINGVIHEFRTDVGSSALASTGASAGYEGGMAGIAATVDIQSGAQRSFLDQTWDTVHFENAGTSGYYDSFWDFELTSEQTTVSYSGSAAVIVPFFDAEAVFINASSASSKSYNYKTRATRRRANVETRISPVFPIYNGAGSVTGFSIGEPVVSTHWGSVASSGELSYESTIPAPKINSLGISVLLCKAGPVDATMGDLIYYFDSEDFCIPGFASWSGVRTDSPTAISPTRIPPQGTDVDSEKAVLVGWV